MEHSSAVVPALPIPNDVSHPDHVVIWATQIPALRFVYDREPRGANYTPLKLIYLEMARRYPEIHDGCTFQRWVEFYIREGLFHFEDDAIHITAAGRELLSLLTYGLSLQQPRPSLIAPMPSTRVSGSPR